MKKSRDKDFAPFLGGEGRKQTDGFIVYFEPRSQNPVMGLIDQFSLSPQRKKQVSSN